MVVSKGFIMPRQSNNRNSPRGNRIAAKVQTLVAEILRDKYMDDDVLSNVSLVGADAHGGLAFVRLFYDTGLDVAVVQKKLDDATRAIRFELAARIDQKYVPEIQFKYDDTAAKASRIEELLKNL
jgi:ribosome-binding factor A